MIDITISPDIITVKGHAQYAEKGKDIICSAVSALVVTFIQSLENLTMDKTEVTHMEDGNIVIIEHKELSQRAVLLRSSFLIGVCGIAENYPDYVNVTVNL